MNNPTIQTLVNDYRALLDFLYRGEDWSKIQRTQKRNPTDYRHIIRALILKRRNPSLGLLGEAEGIALKKSPADHSTIIKSRDMFEPTLKPHYGLIIRELSRFYDSLINREKKIKSKGTHPFKVNYIDGVVQIHLHFENEPSREFLDGLKSLVKKENKMVPA